MNGPPDTAVDESSEHYSWELPDASVQVGISAQAVDRILAEGIRGMGLLRRHGVEVGGVLLGTVGNGGTNSVSIEDAVAVPVEYAFGPTFNLSERDKNKLQEVLRRWDRSLGGPMYVVGFYRTQTHGEPSLRPEDSELFAELFPEPLSVVLLIRPRATGPSVAGLFFREHGKLRTEPNCLEFPMRFRQPGSQHAPPEPVPAPPESEHSPPSADNVPLPSFLGGPAPESGSSDLPATRVATRGHPRWVSWWIQVPILAGLLFVDGLMGFIAARQVRPEPEKAQPALKNPYALSLLVVEYGDNLHLTWDRSAPALASAQKAFLSINDGGQSRSLDLSLEQLRNGSVIYRRRSGQVTLRLEVLLKGKRTVSESWDLTSGKPLP